MKICSVTSSHSRRQYGKWENRKGRIMSPETSWILLLTPLDPTWHLIRPPSDKSGHFLLFPNPSYPLHTPENNSSDIPTYHNLSWHLISSHSTSWFGWTPPPCHFMSAANTSWRLLTPHNTAGIVCLLTHPTISWTLLTPPNLYWHLPNSSTWEQHMTPLDSSWHIINSYDTSSMLCLQPVNFRKFCFGI